jgi:hypothetical protein
MATEISYMATEISYAATEISYAATGFSYAATGFSYAATEISYAIGWTGHVWGERFSSRIISETTDFLWVREYIAENPVKVGLVKWAVEWIFGSLYHRLHRLTSLVDDVVPDTFDDPPLVGQV